MSEPTRHVGDQEFAGDVVFTAGVALPDNIIDEDQLKAGANLPHTKLTHRMGIRNTMETTDSVIASKQIIHQAYRDGTVLGLDASVYTAADSTGRVVTIDILKSTGGTTGTTILSTPLTMNSTDTTARTVRTGSLSGVPTLLNGNLLIRKITVAGSTGAQALGLATEVTVGQDPTD